MQTLFRLSEFARRPGGGRDHDRSQLVLWGTPMKPRRLFTSPLFLADPTRDPLQ